MNREVGLNRGPLQDLDPLPRMRDLAVDRRGRPGQARSRFRHLTPLSEDFLCDEATFQGTAASPEHNGRPEVHIDGRAA